MSDHMKSPASPATSAGEAAPFKKGGVLILGASSAIGRYAAMAFAENGASLYLAGRDQVELERIAEDIRIRYNQKVYVSVFESEKFSEYENFFNQIMAVFPDLEGLLFAIGTMEKETAQILNINFNSAVLLLEKFAAYFESKNSGFIIGISSCAGDRGRKSNYLYGAAKAGLNVYLEGLRHRLFKNHVRVITIKPGFVDTKMTFGLPGIFLAASPEKIGKSIVNTLSRKKDVYYMPWFWRYIMWIIKLIPEWLFKRINL